MNIPITICDFLEQSGAQVTIFDMGRRVVEIPLDIIKSFEQARTPYPQPFLQYAWLGIVFQYPEQETKQGAINTRNIWFIKLPLDEQGLLQQASRDDFLRRTVETLGETFSKTLRKEPQQQEAEDNPHGFTPRDDRMAVFHAKISKKLGGPPSQYYAHALDYFTGKAGYEQWNFVGLQGIADIAARLDEGDNRQILAQAIPHLPITPFAALCSCLENNMLGETLTQQIATRISNDLKNKDTMAVAAGIRGLSHSTDRVTVIATIKSVLENPAGHNVEILAAIAGRAWETLEDPALRILFLENLARCEAGQQAFDGIMADLLFMPELRELIKGDFRNPRRSEKLAETIGAFFQSIQNPTSIH